MSQKIVHSREAQRRVAEAMSRYREAWIGVEEALARLDPSTNGEQRPRWAFTLADLPIEDVHALGPEIARAERRRRRASVALHCLVDLMALDDLPGGSEHDWKPPGADELQALAAKHTGDADWRSGLDRFIGIVNQARRSGVMYVNGTFVPVEGHEE